MYEKVYIHDTKRQQMTYSVYKKIQNEVRDTEKQE